MSAYGISGERLEDHWIEFDWKNEESIKEIDFSKIAAFVFEPGSSLGLVHFPPNELVKKIVSRVRENGGVIIANEVTTGMGRTGKWFGYNYYNITPDIVAIGKGLGNGYPVNGIIKEIRGRGLMIAIEFEDNKGCSYADRINEELLKRNVILVKRPGFEVFRVDPALTIEKNDTHYFLESLEEIISSIKLKK